MREIGVAPANSRFYSGCDSDSAVRVVNAGRARSPGMTEALRVVHEEEIGAPGERRLRMRLEHIGTLENKVADLLSRGDIEEAIARVTARWGVVRGANTGRSVFAQHREESQGSHAP